MTQGGGCKTLDGNIDVKSLLNNSKDEYQVGFYFEGRSQYYKTDYWVIG